jgi:hypothetical protein
MFPQEGKFWTGTALTTDICTQEIAGAYESPQEDECISRIDTPLFDVEQSDTGDLPEFVGVIML